MLPGGSGTLVGHTGSMPGFLATCFVDRHRRQGVVAFGNATTGLPAGVLAGGCSAILESSEPTVPPAWRPVAEVPPEIEEVLGVWHWGYTPYVFAAENSRDGVQLVVRKDGVLLYRFASQRGPPRRRRRLPPRRGAARRTPPGRLGQPPRLRTFIYTRTPYDPDVPVPGGHPGR